MNLYKAPEVLVGQSESERSLVWTLGVIIDELFVGKPYYEKFAEILGPKSTFYLIQTIITSDFAMRWRPRATWGSTRLQPSSGE